jgi:hypothetical protein
MINDMEDWLIEMGDVVIHKKADAGLHGLSTIEVAIYAMWVVDYAVRNSGTLIPMTELYPGALDELGAFAEQNDLSALKQLATAERDDEAFCDAYYQWFEAASAELRCSLGR